VVGRLDHDLVRANAIHFVEHALGLLIQAAFNAERRKLVRNHADRPSRTVFLRRIPLLGR